MVRRVPVPAPGEKYSKAYTQQRQIKILGHTCSVHGRLCGIVLSLSPVAKPLRLLHIAYAK